MHGSQAESEGTGKDSVTPKERILAAMRRQDVDYAPCMPIWWAWASPKADGFKWSNLEERLGVLIDRLGIDTYLDFGIPLGRHPEIKQTVWEEAVEGERYPLLHKVIETPAGQLTATVRKTEDWPHGQDIPLMSDFVVSRLVKPWIEDEQDLDCLEYVWQPPTDYSADQVAELRKLADKWQIPIRSTVGHGLTASLSLFGAENASMVSIERPELLERLADIEHRATIRRCLLYTSPSPRDRS